MEYIFTSPANSGLSVVFEITYCQNIMSVTELTMTEDGVKAYFDECAIGHTRNDDVVEGSLDVVFGDSDVMRCVVARYRH